MNVPGLELDDACSFPCVLLQRVKAAYPCLLVSGRGHLQSKALLYPGVGPEQHLCSKSD